MYSNLEILKIRIDEFLNVANFRKTFYKKDKNI